MTAISLELSQAEAAALIKELLILEGGHKLNIRTFTLSIDFFSNYNPHNVRKEIFNWLSVPERQMLTQTLSTVEEKN